MSDTIDPSPKRSPSSDRPGTKAIDSKSNSNQGTPMPATPKTPSLKSRYLLLDDTRKAELKKSPAYEKLCDKYLREGAKRKPPVWLVLDTQDFLETRDAKRPRTKVEMDPEILAALDECPPTVRAASARKPRVRATAKKPPTRKPRTQRPKAPATQVEITAITVVAEPRPEPGQPVAEIPVTVAPLPAPAPAPAPVTPALKPAPEPTEPQTETAEYHLNEAKRHLVIALGILLTSAGRLAERVQAWAQPHVARLRLSIRTAWMVVPEPMRTVVEAMAPSIRTAISHLARAIILFAIEQVKALAPRVHAITTKWEAEALITLASATEVITARFSK